MFKSTDSFLEFYTVETRSLLMYSSGGILLKWKAKPIIGEACLVSTLSTKAKKAKKKLKCNRMDVKCERVDEVEDS